MKKDFTKTDLFSCPIYKIRIDPNSYDKEQILKDIKYNKSLKIRRNDTEQNFDNCDIHHSYNDFDNEDFRKINYDKLTAVYQEIFHFFFDKVLFTTKEFNWNYEIVNYTALTEGQYLPTHNHIESTFATVHYLNFKDDHKFTRFDNPAGFAFYVKPIQPELYNVLNNKAIDNSYLYNRWDISVEEDDMLIFPGVLMHKIRPVGQTKEPRITISTNLKIFPLPENK